MRTRSGAQLRETVDAQLMTLYSGGGSDAALVSAANAPLCWAASYGYCAGVGNGLGQTGLNPGQLRHLLGAVFVFRCRSLQALMPSTPTMFEHAVIITDFYQTVKLFLEHTQVGGLLFSG